jgi:outer membrane protein TolC
MRGVWWIVVAACGCASPLSFVRYERLARAASAQATVASPGALSTRAAVVRAAIARDPGIVARAARVRAILGDARAEGSMPSPELNAQAWNVPFARPWALGDADMYMVELRQRLPAWGALDARARATLTGADAALAELGAREREVARRVTEAWADYVAAALHHRVHHEHLAIVDAMREATIARIAAGAGLDELARVELERTRVLRLLTRFDNDRGRAERVLRVLTGRAPDAPSELDAEATGEGVEASQEALLERALSRQRRMLEARSRVEGARATVDAARAEASRPEFMVGLSGWFNPNQHSGYGATVAMTLPWLWGPGAARVAAGEANLAAEEASVREAELVTRAEVIEAHARVEGLTRELALVRGDALPASQRALDASRSRYATGGARLVDWLDVARMRLDLAMDEADLVVDLARAVAALEEAVGEPIARVALSREGGVR